jgi:hypothetical protein
MESKVMQLSGGKIFPYGYDLRGDEEVAGRPT